MKNLFNKFDFYPKKKEDILEKSALGGVFTLIIYVIMFYLLISEFSEYIGTNTVDTIVVDGSRQKTFDIFVDISFPHIKCHEISVDVVDNAGGHFTHMEHDIIKMRLDEFGKLLSAVQQKNLKEVQHSPYKPKCGSCFAASKSVPEGFCCNTCDDIINSYYKAGIPKDIALRSPQCNTDDPNIPLAGEVGCRIEGRINIAKLDGNIHVCAGDSISQSTGHHMHRIDLTKLSKYNISHNIHQFSFGENFKGKKDPLTGHEIVERELAQYNYMINVVPTTYATSSGRLIDSHQYSVTLHKTSVKIGGVFPLPGVFFKYSFAGLKMEKIDTSTSFSTFFTRTCAILGGSYIVFGILYKLTSGSIDMVKKND